MPRMEYCEICGSACLGDDPCEQCMLDEERDRVGLWCDKCSDDIPKGKKYKIMDFEWGIIWCLKCVEESADQTES